MSVQRSLRTEQMAIISKRVVVLALLAICLLSVSLRYPLVEHERNQADSYHAHLVSQAIIDDQRAKWTFHPLSYLGYYPFSYPAGVPFLIAEASSLTGTSVEMTTLLLGSVLSIMFALVVFCLSREFLGRREYILLATFLAALGPRFIDNTYWVGSARGPLVVLIAFAVLALVRSGVLRQSAMIFIGVLFAFTCFATHHMAVLLALFGISYVLAYSATRVVRRINTSNRKLTTTVLYFGTVSTVPLVTLSVFGYFWSSIRSSFATEDYVFDFENETLTIVGNLAASYANQFGFIVLFALLGIVVVLGDRHVRWRGLFPATVAFSFVPMLGSSLYISMVILPYIAVLAALWFEALIERKRRRKLALLILAPLVVTSVLLPAWSTAWWNSNEYMSGDTVETSNQAFNDAIYLNSVSSDVRVISNSDIMALQLDALSSVHFVRSGIQTALNDDINRSEVAANVQWSDAPFPTNLYQWFSYVKAPYHSFVVQGVFVYGFDFLNFSSDVSFFARDYFAANPNFVVVIDNNWPDQYVGRWSVQDSKLVSQIRDAEWTPGYGVGQKIDVASYSFYTSERVTAYMVQVPPGI